MDSIPSKTFQYGQTNFISINTDHPRWSPGVCLNLEGSFKVKPTSIHQKVNKSIHYFVVVKCIYNAFTSQDPNRTRAAEKRKLISIKRKGAYQRRQKKHQHKEWGKFQSVHPMNESQDLKASSSRKCIKLEENLKQRQAKPNMKTGLNANELNLVLNCINYLEKKILLEAQEQKKTKSMECITPVHNLNGLRGGMEEQSSGGMYKQDSIHVAPSYLRLINRRNDCFVNSVIQFLAATGYASFLRNHLKPLLVGASLEQYKVSMLLAQLYSGQINRQVSSATIRSYVAQQSGKFYLDDGTQQDAEEFFRALEWTLAEELFESEDFEKERNDHWGQKQIRRIFHDNTNNGKCQNCDQYPSSNVEPFLVMKLHVLQSTSSINLSSLVESHFSESTHTEKIRCSNCCRHDRDQIPCTQTGICSGRQAAEIVQLVEAPEFLLVQLLRYDGKGQKIKTFVKIGDELKLPRNNIYKPLALLNHIGQTQNEGHYVTYRKTDSGQWMFFNDTFNRSSSLKEANSVDNYILLFKKKNTRQPSNIISLPDELGEFQNKVNNEQTKKVEIRATFVGDHESNIIEDGADQENSNDTSEDIINTKIGSINECMLEPEQTKNPCLLDKQCRGCLKVMERLLTHLNSKNGAKCLERYTETEINLHKEMVIANRNVNFYKRNREKRKQYDADNRESILEKKKQHHEKNRDDILEKKKQHHVKKRDDILEKK